MRQILVMFTLCLLFQDTFSQASQRTFGYWAKEYSKEIALYDAKHFILHDVLGETTSVTKFEIDALAASNSGELTTLSYKCDTKGKEGLVLGFYGNKWNEAGVTYQGFAFKDLPLEKAKELIGKIETAINENSKYLNEDYDNNNIYFSFEDITILIYYQNVSTRLRIFWNNFDSEWLLTEFKKTKKRLFKNLQ